jgi:8-oxo-dGTP pyrophosphatase MutT (NUDIX family)
VPGTDLADRTRHLLAAVKAARTPGPPAGAGTYGAVTAPAISPGPSPLVASYGEWTSGRANGTRNALPRDPYTFLSGMFGPLAPIQPVPIDTPAPGEDRPPPRRFQYPVGWDMPMGMPGTEGLGKLADFSTLRTLADLYSVARACIELRKSELRGIGWDIVMTKNAAKANRGSSGGTSDFMKRREQAVKFFEQPDPNLYPDFSSWFDAILEEVLVTDSLSLYVQPSIGKGKGLLGSSIGSLCLVDGTLIRPLVDVRGGRPEPPNVAYQAYQYGVPRVDLMSLLTGADNMDEAALQAEYRGDQLMYLPFSQRTWTPYGQAPIERAIIPVMTGLNKQQYQLNFYSEGTIPGLFVSPGDPNMTPAQIRELQDALNALAGDQAWKHKIIVLPGGSRVDPQKPVSLADQFDEIVMVQVCMAFNVMPMELGISPKVSATQSPGAANQMAKASQDIQERRGVVPLLLWLKSAVFDRVLQGVCGQEDMEWQWEGLEEDEDAETLTNLLVMQVGAGMRSIDEARQELGLDPWGLPITSDPGWATQMGGFVSFTIPPPAPPPMPGQLALPPPKPGEQPQPGQQQPDKPQAKPAPAPAQTRPAVPAAGKPASALSAPSTPAHAGARAAPGPVGTKAAHRELDLLRGYLRKGCALSAWDARHIPGALIEVIAEDLGKGLSVDEVIDGVRGLVPPARTAPVAAGLCVAARDTGRVLMLQRAWDDTDPARGTWEFPGGRLEAGEDSRAAAEREWQEETGQRLPAGVRAAGWAAPGGVYEGHVLVVPSESAVPLGGAAEVANPDDPDGDQFEALAWRDPGVIGHGPDVRPELRADARQAQAAITAALAGMGKAAADLWDPNPVEADHVMAQLLDNYPASALKWMRKARWVGPVRVPQARVDDDDMKSWAASHQPARVEHFAALIRAGKPVRPAVAVQEPGESKVKIIDGHHRTLAWRKLGEPVTAYIGFVRRDGGPWDETHSSQYHSGDDPANKASGGEGAGSGPKVPRNPAWDHDEALAGAAAAQLAAALRQAVSASGIARAWLAYVAVMGGLGPGDPVAQARAWLDGTTAGPAIAAALSGVLGPAWRAAWQLGQWAAARILGEDTPGLDAAAEEDMAALAADGIAAMTGTRLDDLAEELADAAEEDAAAAEAGDAVAALEAVLEDAVGGESGALAVTQTAVTWAVNQGMLGLYGLAGVTEVSWLSAGDEKVCYVCLGNQGAGFVPAGAAFPSGARQPPGHPRCRCCLLPGDIGGTRLPYRDGMEVVVPMHV